MSAEAAARDPLCITCSPGGLRLGEGLARVPRQGTMTFLFTDLERWARRWEAHPHEMRNALARHNTIVRGTVESKNGVVFFTMGGQCRRPAPAQ